MKYEYNLIRLVALLLLVLGIYSIVTGVIDSYDSDLELGPCYDKHNNKIQGLECEIDDSDVSIMIGFFSIMGAFLIFMFPGITRDHEGGR